MCFRKGCCRSGPSRSSCPDSAACDGGLNEDSYSRFLPKTCQDFSQLHNVILSNTEFKGRHHCHRKITIGYEAKLLCGNGLQLHEIATMAKHTSSNTSPENFASQRWQELGGWRLWGQKPCTMEVAPLDLEDCLFCGQVWHHGRQQRITAATGMNAADQDPLRMFTNVCLSSTLHRALCVCMILC